MILICRNSKKRIWASPARDSNLKPKMRECCKTVVHTLGFALSQTKPII